MARQIEHRLAQLERIAGTSTQEPPPPQHDWVDYFRTGLVKFTGPGRVHSVALFDHSGDVDRCVNWLNWQLQHDPALIVLLDDAECNLALAALVKPGKLAVAADWVSGDVGWPIYAKCGSVDSLTLASAAGAAVAAWLDQGETCELSQSGVMALLRAWKIPTI